MMYGHEKSDLVIVVMKPAAVPHCHRRLNPYRRRWRRPRFHRSETHPRISRIGTSLMRGAPAAVRGDAPLYSGHHEPQNVAPDEQRVKPPGRSCTQTYNVPSESGGLVAVNVVRC
jgi:hypothetical protein